MAQVRVEQKMWSGENSPYGANGSLADLANWWSPSPYGIQIGIQAPKNSKFQLNHDSECIIVGETGMFEWNTEGHGYITAVRYAREETSPAPDSDEYIMINIAYEV